MVSIRKWERDRRETWNSFPFSMNEKIKSENKSMTLQDLLETITKLIQENPNRKGNHIICKYDGKISEARFKSPTLDEMESYELNHNCEEYLFLL